MKKYLHILALLLSILMLFVPPNAAYAADEELKINGTQFLAWIVAYREFETRGWDVRNYVVHVKKLSKGYEIDFVPNQEPGKSILGGRTAFGQEITYEVSDDGKITNFHYSR